MCSLYHSVHKSTINKPHVCNIDFNFSIEILIPQFIGSLGLSKDQSSESPLCEVLGQIWHLTWSRIFFEVLDQLEVWFFVKIQTLLVLYEVAKTPLLMPWSHCSLSQSHWYKLCQQIWFHDGICVVGQGLCVHLTYHRGWGALAQLGWSQPFTGRKTCKLLGLLAYWYVYTVCVMIQLSRTDLYHDTFRKTSNISHTSVGNKIVDHSDAVGASPVGAAPTTSSFST